MLTTVRTDSRSRTTAGKAGTLRAASRRVEPHIEGEIRGEDDAGEVDRQEVAATDVTGAAEDRLAGTHLRASRNQGRVRPGTAQSKAKAVA